MDFRSLLIRGENRAKSAKHREVIQVLMNETGDRCVPVWLSDANVAADVMQQDPRSLISGRPFALR